MKPSEAKMLEFKWPEASVFDVGAKGRFARMYLEQSRVEIGFISPYGGKELSVELQFKRNGAKATGCREGVLEVLGQFIGGLGGHDAFDSILRGMSIAAEEYEWKIRESAPAGPERASRKPSPSGSKAQKKPTRID
jgi:hypothetical protein